MWSELTIIGSAGSVNLLRARILEDSREWDLEADRPPLSDTWFKVGSELELDGRLSISVEPSAANLGNANQLLLELERILPTASSVNWNGRVRQVWPLIDSFVMQDALDSFGYLGTFTLPTKPGDWSSPAQSVPTFGYLQTQITLGTTNLHGHYPTEEIPISHGIQRTEGTLIETGDGLWLPASISQVLHARAVTPEAAFKAALDITENARTATYLDARSRTWDLLGLRRVSRRYTKYAKVEVQCDFIPASRYDSGLYPANDLFPSNTLFPR
jgi:hypothetical protein